MTTLERRENVLTTLKTAIYIGGMLLIVRFYISFIKQDELTNITIGKLKNLVQVKI